MRSQNRLECLLKVSAIASAATTAAIAAFGKGTINNAAAPINAVSHIPFGDEAVQHDETSMKYTGTGVALNTMAVSSWAAMYELLFGEAVDRGDIATGLIGGAAISGLAYVVDYHVVPDRLAPGFEKRLGPGSLLGIYSVLALSLGLSRVFCRTSPSPSTPDHA